MNGLGAATGDDDEDASLGHEALEFPTISCPMLAA
jgi:hypothetical protein